MLDFEIVNAGTAVDPQILNIICPSVDEYCASVNASCPSINGACAGADILCSCSNSSCNTGNVFPCANPGVGCRSGCGGARATNCVEPMKQF